MSKQKINIKALIIFSIIIFAAIISGCSQRQFRDTPDNQKVVFYQAATLIEQNYLDLSGNSIRLDTSMPPDINTLIAQMDSSARIWSKDEVVIMNNLWKEQAGIGVIFIKETTSINRVIIKSPADLAGLRRNDKIVEIDGESVEGFSEIKLRSKLQGEQGSEVIVKITGQDKETKVIKMVRQVISPVIRTGLLKNKIGYVRVTDFSQQTPSEVRAAVDGFLKQQVQGLIIDLRNNEGGLLDAVAETTELFVPEGTLIVHLIPKNMKYKKTIKAKRGWNYTLPLAVIIDKNTLSGAELFAAVLKETKRAVLIGEKTHGNGTIRTLFPLKNGSALVMRTAYMKTLTGEIEGQGVTPDVEVVSNVETDKLYDRINSLSTIDPRETLTDIQLKSALSFLADIVAKK